MKEEWLFPGAMVPVDMETTAALVAEIKRLIDVVGGMALNQQRPWVGLTDEEIKAHWLQLWHDINQMKFASNDAPQKETVIFIFAKAIEAKLKEKNT